MRAKRLENSQWQAGRYRRVKRWHPAVAVPAREKIRRLLSQGIRRAWPALLLTIVISPDTFSQETLPGGATDNDITPGQMQSGSLLLRMKNG